MGGWNYNSRREEEENLVPVALIHHKSYMDSPGIEESHPHS
jgi:hypothetical protein